MLSVKVLKIFCLLLSVFYMITASSVNYNDPSNGGTKSMYFQQDINSKIENRRMSAFESYEELCKIKVLEERTCPKLKDCYQKNNLRFVPTKKSEREFLKREEASTFLRTVEADDNDGKENSENILKRFLFASNLAEETKENRDEAFEVYEEYCEKSMFGLGVHRTSARYCPQLNDKLC